MDTVTCLKTRRSVRRFENKPVPRDLLTEVIALAQYAPSWKNTQTARYIIVDDPTLKSEIAENCVLGFRKNTDNLNSAAAAVIVATVTGICGYEQDGSPTTELGPHWQSFDAGIATQTFCLAAHEKGLGSVIMGLFDGKKIAALTNLPDNWQVSCLLAVGYPGEGPHGKPVRKPIDEVLSFK